MRVNVCMYACSSYMYLKSLPYSHPHNYCRPRTAASHPGSSAASQPSTSESHTQKGDVEGERKREGAGPFIPGQKEPLTISLSSAHKPVQATPSTASTDSIGSISSVFPSPHSIPKVHSGLCSVCGRVTNEFDEEVITHCAIVITTCCQRLPTRVSGYLVSRVIPALSK